MRYRYKINFKKLNEHNRKKCFVPRLYLKPSWYEQIEPNDRLRIDYWTNYIGIADKRHGQLIEEFEIDPLEYLIDTFHNKLEELLCTETS